jgi:hypothetical protein
MQKQSQGRIGSSVLQPIQAYKPAVIYWLTCMFTAIASHSFAGFGPLLAVFQPIEASAVQGSLEVFEESTGLVVYASVSAGPTGTYALTLTDGHCDPMFAQAKSRPDFLGRGKPLADPMVLHFVREPVWIRAALGFQEMASMQSKTLIVERLENSGRVLSACGQLRARGNTTWVENTRLKQRLGGL